MSTDAYYNQNAEEFYNRTVNVDMASSYKEFLPYIPKGGAILDAGCGSGRDAKYFQDQGYLVTAIDSSIEIVKLSSQLVGKPTLHLGFAELDMINEFDGIWANASLLHVCCEELPQVLAKLCNALKPEGVLFMTFKYGDQEYIKSERLFNDQNEDSIRGLLGEIPEFKEIKSWKSGDTRAGFADFWLNCLVQKKK